MVIIKWHFDKTLLFTYCPSRKHIENNGYDAKKTYFQTYFQFHFGEIELCAARRKKFAKAIILVVAGVNLKKWLKMTRNMLRIFLNLHCIFKINLCRKDRGPLWKNVSLKIWEIILKKKI